MTEGFEVNIDGNGNKPTSEAEGYTNNHTAYQKIQNDAYCHPESNTESNTESRRRLDISSNIAPSGDPYITYSAGCTRPNSLGATCDICA